MFFIISPAFRSKQDREQIFVYGVMWLYLSLCVSPEEEEEKELTKRVLEEEDDAGGALKSIPRSSSV